MAELVTPREARPFAGVEEDEVENPLPREHSEYSVFERRLKTPRLTELPPTDFFKDGETYVFDSEHGIRNMAKFSAYLTTVASGYIHPGQTRLVFIEPRDDYFESFDDPKNIPRFTRLELHNNDYRPVYIEDGLPVICLYLDTELMTTLSIYRIRTLTDYRIEKEKEEEPRKYVMSMNSRLPNDVKHKINSYLGGKKRRTRRRKISSHRNGRKQ